MTQKLSENAPTSHQTVKFLTAAALGTVMLVLSGLTLTGTVIALVMATPVLLLFSPILVPAGIVVFLGVTGLIFSGGLGVATLAALTWIYNYVAGKHPPVSNQLDQHRMNFRNKDTEVKASNQLDQHQMNFRNKATEVKAREVKDRVKEPGQYGRKKAQEATRQQAS